MPVPQTVRVTAAMAQRQAYRGDVPFGSLPRLRAALAHGDGALQVDLQAGKERGRERLRGTVSGELPLQCARCEQVFNWPLDTTLDVCLVHSEEEEQAVLHDTDPYLVADDSLPLRELVEDETLLALPMLPRCESCENAVQAAPGAIADEAASRGEAPAEGPFAALKKQLKSKQQ